MAVNVKQNGDVEIPYAGPWKGIDVQAPENLIDPAEVVLSNNWLFRNKAISSRPRFVPWTNDLGGSNFLNGVGTFLSPLGAYHTFATGIDGTLYNLNGVTNGLERVTILPHLASTNPLQWRTIYSTNTNQSALYFVSGSNTVCSWDGTTGPAGGGGVGFASIQNAGSGYAVNDTGTLNAGGANATYKVTAVGGGGAVTALTITAVGTGYLAGVISTTTDGGAQPGVGTGLTIFVNTVSGGGPEQDVIVVSGVTIGARYIGSLAQHMLLLNTTGVTGQDSAFTIRYSAVGLPLVFDPAVNINAGFYQMIDFTDQITGAMFLGRVAYLYHRTGITEMAPTGVGTNPFEFNHIWNANDGTGSIFPYTIAQYGQVGAFVSSENVYMVQNYSFQPIGGTARDAIFADLHSANQLFNSNTVIGALVPAYIDNYVYTLYQIYMPVAPGGSTTIMWQYSVEQGYWERHTLTNEIVSGIPYFCLVH